MKKTAATALCLVMFVSVAWAKLPPLSDEAKAKAAEAAAKTAHTGKVDGYKLCKSMDQVATTYFEQTKKAGKTVPAAPQTPACADPGPFVYAPPGAAPAPAAGSLPAAAPSTAPAAPAVISKAPAAAPVAAVAPKK